MEKQETKPVQALKAHLAINVRDVEESIGFYKRLFGIEPSKVRTGYAKFNVENPPLNFTLNQVPFGERGALSHLGIQVGSTEDVMAVRERWTEEGLLTRDEMQTSCCYAVQDKTWVADPDGNQWEVFVVHKDNLPTYYGEGDACSTQSSVSCSAEAANETVSCGCASTSETTG